jgi:hypothetical protein
VGDGAGRLAQVQDNFGDSHPAIPVVDCSDTAGGCIAGLFFELSCMLAGELKSPNE